MENREEDIELRRKFTLTVLNRDPETEIKKGGYLVIKMAMADAPALGIVQDEKTGKWYVKE